MRFPVPPFRKIWTSIVWWSGVALSLLAYFLVGATMDREAKSQFIHGTNIMHAALQEEIESHVHILRAAQALVHSQHRITREEFHRFARNLDFVHNYPALRNLNYAFYVRHQDKHAFEEGIRRDDSLSPDGYPEFAIRPAGDRAHYHVLTYLEPQEETIGAFGFNMLSVEAALSALARMRDTSSVTSTGLPIRIGKENPYSAIVMRLPVYRKGMPTASTEQRQAALAGSIGIAVDLHAVMDIVAGKLSQPGRIRTIIKDLGYAEPLAADGGADEERLVYDSHPQGQNERFYSLHLFPSPDISHMIPMTVAGRQWQLEFASDRALLLSRFDRYLCVMILLLGLGASFLLAQLFHLPNSARRQAVQLANEMTKDLRRSEAHLAEAQHMANLGSWQLDPVSQSMQWSLETFRIFGYPPTTALYFDDFLKRVHDEDRQTVRDGLEQSFLTSAEFDYEHRIVREDGSVRWVQTLCRPVRNDRRKNVRGTIMDITERKLTMQALQRSQELLRELTAHQDRIKEEERRRIAREIHDELGQTLLALRIEISMLEARTSPRHSRLNARIRLALQQLDATVRAVRGIINDLRPSVLDLGLVAAIEWQVAEFRRRSDIECELFIDDPDIQVDNDSATTLFRILQESLTNIIRHAQASRIAVSLYSQDGWLSLKIMDNGVGLPDDARKKPDSFGLVGIEERVLALNGRFSLSSMPNSGTTLIVSIPVAPDIRLAMASLNVVRKPPALNIDVNSFLK